jgi:hypothetical protein
LKGVLAEGVMASIMIAAAAGIQVGQEMADVNWLDIGAKYGPLGIAVMWFLYRDYKREQAMTNRINHLTDSIFQSTLRSQTSLTEAIRSRPCILLRCTPGDDELIEKMGINAPRNEGDSK